MPRVPSCPTWLTCLLSWRTYVHYVLKHLTCLRAFVLLLLTCLAWLTCSYFFYVPYVRAVIFLRALCVFVFYMSYVSSFFYVPYVPSSFYVPHEPSLFCLFSIFGMPYVPSLFYVKCGTNHNQAQQAGINKNEVE